MGRMHAVTGLWGGLMAGAFGLVWLPPEPARLTQLPELPHLWLWSVRKEASPIDRLDVAIVVRRRSAGVNAGRVAGPLRPGEGDAAVYPCDTLGIGQPLEGSVALQLHDVRHLGFEPAGPAAYRLRCRATTHEAARPFCIPLDGHSLRWPPEPHRAEWRDGELPLLTLHTLTERETWRWTVSLAAR